jgi:hypothetical protein
MCHPAVYYGALAVSGALSAKAQYDQAQYEKGVSEYNARVSENRAKDERARATEAMSEERQKAMELRSRQRAIAASRGVQVDYGSALGIQEDTEMMGRVNAQRINEAGDDRYNAFMQEGALTRSAGDAAQQSGSMKVAGTLIGTAGSMAGGMSNFADTGGTVAPQWYSSTPKKYSLNVDYGSLGR